MVHEPSFYPTIQLRLQLFVSKYVFLRRVLVLQVWKNILCFRVQSSAWKVAGVL